MLLTTFSDGFLSDGIAECRNHAGFYEVSWIVLLMITCIWLRCIIIYLILSYPTTITFVPSKVLIHKDRKTFHCILWVFFLCVLQKSRELFQEVTRYFTRTGTVFMNQFVQNTDSFRNETSDYIIHTQLLNVYLASDKKVLATVADGKTCTSKCRQCAFESLNLFVQNSCCFWNCTYALIPYSPHYK